MTLRPSRRALAAGFGLLLAGVLISTAGFVSLRAGAPAAADPAPSPAHDLPAAGIEPATTGGAGEPATRRGPDNLVEYHGHTPKPALETHQPAEPPAPRATPTPIPRPDPARLAGGPFVDQPTPAPELRGAPFRIGEDGFWRGLALALRPDHDLFAEIWREKGAVRGWQMPRFQDVVSHASGVGGSKPPKVNLDPRFAAALSRVGDGRPGPFSNDIYNQISPAGLVGVATWYGEDFHGQVMRYGDIYDMYDPTITACNVFPGGTRLRVTASNGRYVDVVVRDTGAFQYPIVVDLSWAAFAMLGDPDWGVMDVVIEPIDQLPSEVLASYGPQQAPFRTPPAPSAANGVRLTATAAVTATRTVSTTGATATAAPAPTRTATPTPRLAPTATPTPTEEPAKTPTPTAAATPRPSATPTRPAGAAPAATPSPTPPPTPPPTARPSTPTPPATRAPTAPPAPTATPTPEPKVGGAGQQPVIEPTPRPFTADNR